MKLRKFFGLTSRSVLEQVRAELGADAVIVANHATAEGIEVTALAGDAIDTLLAHGKRRAAATGATESRPVAVAERAAAPPLSTVAAAGHDDIDTPDESEHDRVPPPAPAAAPAVIHASAAVGQPQQPAPTQETLASRVLAEVAAMREVIEDRLALVTWNEDLRRRPLAAKLTLELLAAGYSAGLARTIMERLPDDMRAGAARNWVLDVLSRNLHCVGNADEIVTRGGVYALIGSTGVGKTTTTAKLAARCAVRYGASQLALITTDSFRVGAKDQLRIYAKILGVAVHTVSDRHDLRQALDAVRGRHLVLIDTVGMSQRDARIAEQSLLLAHPEIRRILLLNAAAQGEMLDEVVQAYGNLSDKTPHDASSELAGCIVTKQDEAVRHGAALDVAIRHKLPLHYVTSGQRVPEDLFVPAARLMIERSLRSLPKLSAFTLTADDLPLAIASGYGAAHA